ncbi:TonB-dependent receptor plug domain-containing protein [Roseivirga sp.]|uniref:TonB-dependent receptor plug domain-containing protein n=1 Tax=Roseivirga sp. TaxID=1964215 RepID=UPI003B51BF9D
MNLNKMQNRGIISLLFCLLFTAQLSAQELTFISSDDGQPVPFLTVSFQSVNTERILRSITNEQGRITLPTLEFPLIISTSHINYETFTDTITTPVSKKYRLLPVSTQLDDVIVTGQFSPQSVKNSVFRVQTINRKEIEQRGAINLEQALQTQLNLRITQDLAIGSSGIGLQGISSQNVKILVDGVPLVNRNGNGNAADLSQINLQQIDRIEIVEGPMAVNYGANALAGVINLITRKDFDHQTEIRTFIQSESAGTEVGPTQGKHIQSLEVNHQFSKKWSVLLHGQHNDFQGFQGNAPGRTHEWNPKNQWTGSGLIKYETANHTFFYRAEVLDELIEDFGQSQSNYTSTGEFQPFAIDENYHSQRLTQQLQAEGSLPFLDRYNLFASYSDFRREKSRFAKNLVTKEERLTTATGDQDTSTYQVWEFGGAGYLAPASQLDVQIGYQISLEDVGGGRIAEGEQSIEEYSAYTSLEWKPSAQLTIRPGARFTSNSAFGNQVVPALQIKQQLSDKTNLRFSYGKGFRAPSVRELYFEFVDSNHRIYGNPDLKPETSNHLGLNLLTSFSLAGTPIQSDLNLFFNDISDQIAIGTNPQDITSASYININRFKTLGATLSEKFLVGSISANIGMSYIGRYNRLAETEGELDEFFFSPEVNANLSYQLPKWKTSFHLYYKYTGRLQSYFVEGDEVSIGAIDDYHWLDATINHPISKSLELLLGARNIFNVERVSNSGVSSGAHSGGSSVALAYGRSYFLKISYNLSLK